MEDTDLPEKYPSNPAALALTDFRPELNEKGLDITPRDSCPDWMGKYGFQGSAVLSSHTENGTTSRYYPQAPKLCAHRLLCRRLTRL
jgi:hypothetical protein